MKQGSGLNANHLKLIAIAAMTIDHSADLFFPNFPCEPVPIVLHLIGRLTAPIMWFFVCEGYHYTRNSKMYMLRMLLFAVISHFAYCFAFEIDPVPFRSGVFNQTSVMYPLFAAVAALRLIYEKPNLNKHLNVALVTIVVLSAFPANWSCPAVLAVIGMSLHRGDLKGQMKTILLCVGMYGLVSFFFVDKVYALVLPGVLMVYPLLKRYNGGRGKAGWMKWFFYIYYPAHLILIGILRLWLFGGVPLLF